MTDKQKDIKIKTICNCCLICHDGTNNPNPFYICDKCKTKLKIGDSISRHAVLNTLDNMDNVLDEDRTVETYKMLLTECVNVLPPVTPQPKMGRWIPTGYDGYADGNPVYDWWECSECGWEHTGDEDTLTPYCPNCGAKMEESDANSD